MKSFTVHEAKTHLSRLIARATAGEEIVIARGREPVVRLVPIRTAPTRRIPGKDQGKIWIADDFGVLPKELQEAFEAPLESGRRRAPRRAARRRKR